MAALDFPNSGLTTGTTYTGDNGTVYIYDGVKWVGQVVSSGSGFGPTGPQGPSGLNGATGPQGPAGADGPTGPSGADSIVPGPTGPSGAEGPTGPSGGLTGPSGPSGPSGTNGAIGPQGPSGLVGPAGPTGPQGDPSILPGPTGPSGPSGIGSLNSVDEDPAPRLGGTLNLNGNIITSSTGTSVTLRHTGTGILLQGPVSIGSAANNIDGSLYLIRQSYSSFFNSSTVIAQHHDIPDVVNLSFYRTRGTATVPTSVQPADDIADIDFLGHNGVARLSVGTITMSVDEVITNSTFTGKLKFDMRSIDGQILTRSELSSSGTWKVDKLSHLSTTTSSIAVTGNLIPTANLTYDLGSTSSQWRSLYAESVKFNDGSTQTTAYTGIVWSLSASGTSDYVFSGPGIVTGNTNDPVLYLYRGFTYTFVNTAGGAHPLAIRVSNGGADYTDGVSGSQTGTQTFTVPMNAPSTLYYQCTNHSVMGNVINIV